MRQSSLVDDFEQLIALDPLDRASKIQAIAAHDPGYADELQRLIERDAIESPLDGPLHAEAWSLIEGKLKGLPSERSPEIAGYSLLGLLGEGGMGRVYLAERDVQGFAQRVAIKVTRPGRATKPLRARFLAEQRHLAVLDHPGICRFIDAGVLADGGSYVVMEAVEGCLLLDYCDQKGLDLRERIRLLRRLLEAVAHAHERLLIHRDIKPANVMVTSEGQPKLLDFGIAKSLGPAADDATGTAERLFTPSACSPEQLTGRVPGVASDIYALGLLAFQLLSGRPAYDLAGMRPSEAEACILHRPAPRMSAVADASTAQRLRGDLDAIMDRCLRKDPDDRYANVRELDADLERWLQRKPVRARPAGAVYRIRLFLRRHQVAAVLSTLALASLIAAGVGMWLQALEIDSQRMQALDERDRALELGRILERAFIESDPARAEGRGVSVRAILDGVARRLDDMRVQNPRLFAQLADSIAKVELGLGADTRAGDLADSAIAALGASAEHADTRRSLRLTAASAHARTGRFQEADALLAEVLADDGDVRVDWLLARALLDLKRSDYPAAEASLDRVLRDAAGPTDPFKAQAEQLQVETLALQGRIVEAIQLQQRLVSNRSTDTPADHPSALLAQLELLRLQARSESLPPGIVEEFDSLIPRLAGHYGERSVVVAGALAASAPAALRAGQRAHALDSLRRAAVLFEQSLGGEHARALRAKFNLAQTLISLREFAEAEVLLTELQRQLYAQFGEGVPMAITVGLRRAVVLAHLGKGAEAANQLDAAAQAVALRSNGERLQAAYESARGEVEALVCGVQGDPDQRLCAGAALR